MIKIFSIHKKTLIVSISLVLLSCNMKVYTLLDKVTNVPKDTKVYKNKEKFNATILNTIDTAVVYEELNTNKNLLERLVNCNGCHRKYLVYKFYPNGCFNLLSFRKDSSLSVNKFNPNYTGHRGIYYFENNKIRYDFFAGIDQRQHTGKITGTLSVKGDTLFVRDDDRKGIDATSYSTEIYIKRKLPPEYFQFKANW